MARRSHYADTKRRKRETPPTDNPRKKEEACHGDEGSVLEGTLQRLPSSSGSQGRYRADACRPGHTVWRIHAAFLAADLLLGRAEGPATRREGARRRAGCVPRWQWCCRPVGASLPTPRHVARIRPGWREGDTLLLSWLAVRC